MEDLVIRPAPGGGVLECTRVLLEHLPSIVSADLLRDDLRDITTPAAGASHGIDERQRFFGQGDVGPNQTHRVAPNVDCLHTL